MGWNNKSTGGYTTGSAEGRSNANKVLDILQPLGYSLASICGILGNIQGESGLNPWRWQSDHVPTYSEFYNWTSSQASAHGYGLFQFTPANKYINDTNYNAYYGYGYAPNFSNIAGGLYDGSSQLEFFNNTFSSSWINAQSNYNYYYQDFIDIGVDISSFYWASYSEFKTGVKNGVNMTIPQLTGAFELCYERPNSIGAAQSYNARCNYAQTWWDYFQNTPPTPDPDPPLPPTPPTPPPVARKKMPLWMMLRHHW